MRIAEPDYDTFSIDHFPSRVLVRAHPDFTVWSAGVEPHLLILVNKAKRRVILFEYDDEDEEGAGVPASVKPTPPSRAAQNAQPMPR